MLDADLRQNQNQKIFKDKEKLEKSLKGVFAKNQRGYRLTAKNKRF